MKGHKREADTATETMEEKKGKWDHGERVVVEEEVSEEWGSALTSARALSQIHR